MISINIIKLTVGTYCVAAVVVTSVGKLHIEAAVFSLPVISSVTFVLAFQGSRLVSIGTGSSGTMEVIT